MFARKLSTDDKAQSAEVAIETPREEADGSSRMIWMSAVAVDFGNDRKTADARGDNPIQAIVMAAEFARRALRERGKGWEDEAGVPDWILFPRVVPISWGKAFHDGIVDYIETCEAELNEAIERRRSETESAGKA